ncbi:hypothetical protein AB0O22_19850 [Streptomyces sp. NPDC091204]|uniref:hypothetical protein n=1 Tax=Streptomyces sp. NPDC091204 TaxID=3155299 RepID=UPI0034216D46
MDAVLPAVSQPRGRAPGAARERAAGGRFGRAAREPVELACGAVVLAATPGLSPAWKVLWLVGDRHPQGKDLYDAVLPAERCRLPNALVQEVFREAGGWPCPNAERCVGAGWEDFEAEYPRPAGPGEEAFLARLVGALRPTFPDAP